jgi:hypothetical protein
MPEVNMKVTPGEILISVGAIVTLVFSFLHFYTSPSITVHAPFGGATVTTGGGGINAWASEFVPVVTLIVLFTLVMATQVLLDKFTDVDFGPGIAGFTWVQVHLALGFFAALESFCWLIAGKGGAGIGVGLIFMLIGSIGCFVGAILLRSERS